MYRSSRYSSEMVLHITISLMLAVLLIVLAGLLLEGISKGESEAQTTLVREATRRALVTCYAVEGRYPADVEVLKENYGLHYDDDDYIVILDAFATNVMPDIRIMKRGSE